ncbi:unnamed protein product [Brassica oleracea]
MNLPQVNFRVTQSRPLSPSEGYENSLTITIDTKSYDFLENPTTGHRIFTGRSTPVYPPALINISLLSSSPHDIFRQLLRKQAIQDTNRPHVLAYLAKQISAAAISLGFGRNGFVIDIDYKVVYANVVVRFDHPPRDESLSLRASLLRLVLLGSVGHREETKGLKMETEPCSICLDNLVVSSRSNSKRGVPTRMTCSHNMIRPHVELSDFKHERRSGSYANSIIIVVGTMSDEIQVSPSVRVDISLPSFLGRHHIRRLIQDQLINRRWLSPKISRTATKLGFSRREVLQDQFASHRWLSDKLAPGISEIHYKKTSRILREKIVGISLGFGCNGLIVTITVKITPSPSKEEVLTMMVQLGKISKEELKSSKMETEPCSICLDNLVSGKHGVSTRMTCSHVFHEKCLLVWFQRKNTCPLCRTVLYDRLMIGNKGSRN